MRTSAEPMCLPLLFVAGLIGCGNPEAQSGSDQVDGLQVASLATQEVATPIQPIGRLRTAPRLLDIGSTRCVPCRLMAPLLEELRVEYGEAVVIEFIDAVENPDLADEHEAYLIPTQVFFDATGAEVFRHEGFMGKEAIIAQFDAMGIPRPSPPEE